MTPSSAGEGSSPAVAAPFAPKRPSALATREEIQKTYIRVCGDSAFKMEMVQAAHFAAKLIGIRALDIWLALGFDNMERIANGTHPALLNPHYADEWTRERAAARAKAEGR